MTHPLERRLARLEPQSSPDHSGARDELMKRIEGIASRIPPGTHIDLAGRERVRDFFIGKGWLQASAIIGDHRDQQ